MTNREWLIGRDHMFYVYGISKESVRLRGDPYNIAKAQYLLSERCEEFGIKAGAVKGDQYLPYLYIHVPSSKGGKYEFMHQLIRRHKKNNVAPKKEFELSNALDCGCEHKKYRVRIPKRQELCVHEIAEKMFFEHETEKIAEEYCKQTGLSGISFAVEKKYDFYPGDIMHLFEQVEKKKSYPSLRRRNIFYWYLRFRKSELCQTVFDGTRPDFLAIVKAAKVYYEDVKEGYLRPI